MKQILLILTILGLGLFGLVPAFASYNYSNYRGYNQTQYYNNNNNNYDTNRGYSSNYTSPHSYTNPNYNYTNSNYNPNYNTSASYYAYSGGTGSYTIGCTTHYYSTRTRAELYTQNICNYQYNEQYNKPSSRTSYYYYPNESYSQNYGPDYYSSPSSINYSYPYYINDNDSNSYYTNGYTDTGYNNYYQTDCNYWNGSYKCY